MTNQEISDFIDNPNQIEFEETNRTNSIKSNIYILANNFLTLRVYLNAVKLSLLFIKNLVNIDTLLPLMLNRIQTDKLVLTISYDQVVGSNVTQIINGIEYNLFRETPEKIVITNLTNAGWITDNLIIQLKDNLNTVVSSGIITENNSIIVLFGSEILTNYKMLVL